MAKNELNSLALGYAGAIISAACMLLISIGSALGIYDNAAKQMTLWHEFYTTTVAGTITGMVEAAIISFVSLYLLGLLYNKFI